MSSLQITGTVEQCNHSQKIETFRKEQAITKHKDQLTTLFVNGPSVANRELYAPPEEIAKEFKQASVEREFLRKAVESYSRKHSDKENSQTVNELERCQNFAALEKVLQEQAQQWKQKKRFLHGAVQNTFHRVCKTLDGHQSILSAIPEGSEYVSVFCAALNTVIQASLNHQATAENLLKDTVTINEVISCALDRAVLFRTKTVIGKFADLYAHIFYFYTAAIGWFKSRSSYKILQSLNKNSYEDFATHIAEIQRIGLTIQSRAEIGGHAEIRDMHTDVQTLLDDQRGLREIIGKVGEARAEAEQSHQRQMEQIKNDIMDQQHRFLSDEQSKDDINQKIFIMLKGLCETVDLARLNKVMAQGHADAEIEQRMIENGTIRSSRPPTNKVYKRDYLVSETTAFQDFIIEHDLIEAMLDEPQARSLSNTMFHRLQTFILSKESESLWISGPLDMRYPSAMSAAAACIISVLSQAEPQLIFHFCALPRDEHHHPTLSGEESGLIGLLYSLIIQLISALKPRFESAIDLGHERFTKLDGSMATFSDALKLFEDLVSISSPYIIGVIDGIEWIDYGRGSSRFREFLTSVLRVMGGRSNEDGTGSVFKLLFTTAGNSGTLMDTLNAADIFEDSGGMFAWKNDFQQTGQDMVSLTEL